MTDDSTAYHEAGHVLIAALLGGEVIESTLESDEPDHTGRTTIAWRESNPREQTRNSALTALAGPIAEAIWRGDDALAEDPSTWRGDWQEIESALTELAPATERAATLQQWVGEVVRELQDPNHWEYVCRIADALAAHETLDRDLLTDLLDPE